MAPEEDKAPEKEERSPIQQFFHGKSLFITGVTGMIGKILIERLLRCCPGIVTIYVLMRPKRRKTPDERIEAILNVELFDIMKKVCPTYKEKIVVIDGDLEKPRLGISDEDFEKMKPTVSVVFHSAARLKFNDPLRTAVQYQMTATADLINMIKEFDHIPVFVHVSTSYVHRDPDLTVPEYVPRQRVTPTQLLDSLKWMSDDVIDAMTPMFVSEKHTTYMFTKALTENVIVDIRDNIPVAIVRPCYISPTFKDPFPGWCDTIQGMQGLVLAASKGFLRTLHSFKDFKINIIPADIVVSTIIAAAWQVGTQRKEDILVVNCVIEYDKLPYANQAIMQELLVKREKYPLVNMYRYPDFHFYFNKFFYTIHVLVDHYIPAISIDLLLFIFTGKTLMVRLYRRIDYMFGMFTKIAKEPWICGLKNFNLIKNRMSPKDSELFSMETEDLEWPKYIDDCMQGGRKYLAHEPPSNIPYAKKKAKIWWLVTTILKWCLILCFLYFIFPGPYIKNWMNGYVERQPYVLITESG